jgi:hypothetical protein
MYSRIPDMVSYLRFFHSGTFKSSAWQKAGHPFISCGIPGFPGATGMPGGPNARGQDSALPTELFMSGEVPG